MLTETRRLLTRLRRDRENAERRRTCAREFAVKLAKDLGSADPGVREIVGFGSTFESWRRYRMDSDIDLGMYGGDWSLLWSLIPESEFVVSLVELDLQPETFTEQIRAHGVVLYEKQ